MFSLLLIAICFLFNSCSGPEPASKITDISDIKAEIDVFQRLTDENNNSISVILYDKKGKKFGNDSVKISVNGKKAEYKVMPYMYYSKLYHYRAEKVPPIKGNYEIQIQLANGKKLFLARIPSLPQSSSKNIIYEKEAPLNRDFSIQWSGLRDVNVLYLSKSVQVKNRDENNVETFIEKAADTIKIGPDGNYTLKKENFSNPGERLSIASFEFTAEKTGTLNPKLIKGSTAKISGSHEERVSFK
ncbi:hypothetical protein ACM46_20450 [Chryseobacterium angstadtii]|uniref:Uncharacterized protein n=2 Tax=Chryseobacterium angstadtii TaxID=558151 RepID=A0A0J7I0H6_9FLAO|nr:hypothetical protein ACM46_20450 [Chryseobacterium angstadtii]